MKIVRVAQGSPEWYEHRRKYRNASETPAVLGVSPWHTPYQLWQLKLGLIEQQVTPAMRRGTELEPVARAAYERQTDRVMQPLVVVDGEYSASLDGLTLDGERILEVKCPAKGHESGLWQAVATGTMPEYYQVQVQHQLLVTKAAVADVYVFDGETGILLEVAPDPNFWPTITDAWDKFATLISAKTLPPLATGDIRQRSDAAWSRAAARFLETKLFAEQAQRVATEAREALIGLTSHTSESGSGVTVTRYWKTGAIDYKKIPELQAIDVDQYRGPPREETRVTVD